MYDTGKDLQKTSRKDSDHAEFLRDLHLQFPNQESRHGNHPKVQGRVERRICPGAIKDVVVSTFRALVEGPLAVERLGYEALSDEVRHGQGDIEELCGPENSLDFWTLEDTLVKEEDRHFGDCQRDCV